MPREIIGSIAYLSESPTLDLNPVDLAPLLPLGPRSESEEKERQGIHGKGGWTKGLPTCFAFDFQEGSDKITPVWGAQ